MLVFDIETNAVNFKNPRFIEEIERIHCLVIYDTKTKEEYVFNSLLNDIDEGLRMLERSSPIGGHNVQGFDVPAIQRLYPTFKPQGVVWDSLVLSEMVYGDNLRWIDRRNKERGEYNLGRLTGAHSLKAWGIRLGNPKDDYVDKYYGGDAHAAFAEWTPEMETYCQQDVGTNGTLFQMFHRKGILAIDACETESRVASILARQKARGVCFSIPRAIELQGQLVERREHLRAKLVERFGSFYRVDGSEFTPKRDSGPRGYTAGAPLQKLKLVEFNPASDTHAAYVLKQRYKWEPVEFTDKGAPSLTESVLKGLPYDFATDLYDFRVVNKRLSQLSEGDTAWLKMVTPEGRIHGTVKQNGTRTGRMSHVSPNLSAVPRVGNPYGQQCRSLFIATPGWKLVGCDAEGIELRLLGHFLGRYDDGAFARSVVSGRKEDGTDAHSLNRKAIGSHTRDGAKTFIYAYLYGAGNAKLGRILYEDMDDEGRARFGNPGVRRLAKLGAKARRDIEQTFPAFDRLQRQVRKAVKRGWMLALDGRRLYGVSAHNGLNTLLQSAGGLVMKKALVLLDQALQTQGLSPGCDYEFVLNVHDEWQIECRPECAATVGVKAAMAITRAGKEFNLRVPLAGDYRIGESWAETH